MKRTFLSAAMMLVGALAGCGTTDTSSQTEKCQNVMCPTGQTCSATSGLCEGTIDKCMGVSCTFPQGCDASTGMCANPLMPSTSGALMDRMGRPAVNTALTNPFDLYKQQGTAETDSVTKDRYNKDGNVSTWGMTWGAAIAQHLAFFDGLDSVCTNQLARTQSGAPYSYLAGLLANDTLLVDTSKTTCNQYLGVELAALSLGGMTDCGGRTLSMDVIDITYSALIGGQISGSSDGISQSVAPATAFPFFTGPM